MSKINIRDFYNENEDGAPDIVGVSTFSSTAYFVPTKGNTQQRPSDHVEVGSIRFNTDTSNLEYYRGHTLGWSQFELIDPELGGGTGSNTGLGTRGLVMGGSPDNSNGNNTVDYITITTLGDSQDFGDLTDARKALGSLGGRVRALAAGGTRPSYTSTVIDFATFSSTGNFTDFGDTSTQGQSYAGLSDGNRGIFAGGYRSGITNIIEYVTIAQTGNVVDFGDITQQTGDPSGVNSSTRGVVGGGHLQPAKTNVISFITITTTGNAADFGDLTVARSAASSGCNSTRGIFATGNIGSTNMTNVIDFITIATTGNATDFGDATTTFWNGLGGMSSPTRMVFGGGITPTVLNTLSYVEILTTGNSVDFGDASTLGQRSTSSNGHGGL